ncbi:MAG: DUF5694 domain-containing protein, partial [Bacteroidota bacterium]
MAVLLILGENLAQSIPTQKLEVLLLGTLHFDQFHNPNKTETDFSGEVRQKEFQQVVDALARFNPDAVFIEREPNQQPLLDSLYDLRLDEVKNIKGGLSEAYQIGFRIAKQSNLKTVHGIDYYESVPQNLLIAGKN